MSDRSSNLSGNFKFLGEGMRFQKGSLHQGQEVGNSFRIAFKACCTMQKHISFQRLGILTGSLLLLGFFLPISLDFSGGVIYFPNIQFLGQDLFPFSVRLYLLLPLLGGVACLIALVPSNSYVRAGLYFFAGFTPWVMEYVMTSELLSYLAGLNSRGFDGASFSITSLISGFLLRFGLLGMFAAAFAGRANPKAKLAHYFAMVGSVMVIMALMFPTQSGGDSWRILILMPFEALGSDAVAGSVLMVLLALLLAATVLGILWGIGYKKGTNNAKSMKWLLLIALLFSVITLFCVLYVRFPPIDRVRIGILELLVGYIKVLGIFLAPLFAQCLGAMELLAMTKEGEENQAPEVKSSPGIDAAEASSVAELPFDGRDSE